MLTLQYEHLQLIMPALNNIVKQITSRLVLLHRATLFWYFMQWHNNRCTKSGPSFITEWYVHIALFTDTPMGSDACLALPTYCLLLQGLCMCFRCSEASHAHSAHKVLMWLTSSLNSFTHTISRDSIYIFDHASGICTFLLYGKS